jgi:flagellar basal-body rod modification protein FlgD
MTTINTASGIQNLISGTGGAALSKTSADFNMFLKMLTTQMQNQDPLDPMDSSEYTQQLVQYSQVEQSIQQTGALKDILSRLSTQEMSQAAGFIGREAQFDSNLSGLAGTSPAHWTYSVSRRAATLTATITDASGKVVDTRALNPANLSGRVSWDGTLAGGAKAADGPYAMTVQAFDSAGVSIPVSVGSIGIVNDVVTANNMVSLRANGVAYSASKLVQVSAAGK